MTDTETVELCTIDNCDYPSHWDGPRNPLCANETEQQAAAGLRICSGDVSVAAAGICRSREVASRGRCGVDGISRRR